MSGRHPKTLTSFLFSPPLSQNENERKNEVAGGQPEEQRRPRACSPVGDVHSRGAPLSSGFAAIPLAVARTHNLRVVAGDRRCSGATFPDSNGLDPANGGTR
jgi:hypothetical protein